MRRAKCNCDDRHEINSRRGDGMLLALWVCPIHGNIFEEQPLGITLTDEQNEVLRVILERHKAGEAADADTVSRVLNLSTWRTDQAFAVLRSVGFIEAA